MKLRMKKVVKKKKRKKKRKKKKRKKKKKIKYLNLMKSIIILKMLNQLIIIQKKAK